MCYLVPMNMHAPINAIEEFRRLVKTLIQCDLPVVCDFSGTLSQCRDERQINEPLFELLELLKSKGLKVIVASTEPDSSSMAMSFIAVELDLPDNELTHIQDKKKLGNMHAGLVFDDKTPDYLKGFYRHFDMSDIEIIELIDRISLSMKQETGKSKPFPAP